MWQRFKDLYQNAPLKKKIIMIFLLIAFLVFLMIYGIYSIGLVVRSINGNPNGNPFYYALKTPFGQPLVYILAGVIILLIILVVFNTDRKNFSYKADSRGVHIMKKGTFGTSDWMDEAEAKKAYTVSNIKETKETVYGQYTKYGENVVAYKKKENGSEGNHNTLVLASMGAGKSFCYVRTELCQAIERENSFVVTDPSAELYTDLGDYARSKGYDVKVLNLADPLYSDCWDILSETIDPETERIDAKRLNDFVDVFMKNSNTAGTYNEQIDFWYGSALNLIKSVISYVSYKHDKKVCECFISIFDAINSKQKNYVKGSHGFIQALNSKNVSFKDAREYIVKTAIKNGFIESEIRKSLELAHEVADCEIPFTLQNVFDSILDFTKGSNDSNAVSIEKEMEIFSENTEWKWHPLVSSYKMYKTNDTENVRKSALQGAQLRFSLFTDDKLATLFSKKGIDLSDINIKKSAYFVITPDKPSASTKPITSLFFSFLFTDAQVVYDKYSQLSKEQNIENPCRPLVTMLDEFYSLGMIGGSDPSAFGTILSNSRKRQIYISIISQTYPHIEALYGPKIKHVIQGGCDTLLYLGGNDPETCEFISEFASGEATVLSESHEEITNIVAADVVKPGYRSTAQKRFLLTVDEARRWKDKVLVVTHGEKPLSLNPFPWIEHPAFEKCKKTSVYKTINPVIPPLDFDNEVSESKDDSIYQSLKNSVYDLQRFDEEAQKYKKLCYLISGVSEKEKGAQNSVVDPNTGEVQENNQPKQNDELEIDGFTFDIEEAVSTKKGADTIKEKEQQSSKNKNKKGTGTKKGNGVDKHVSQLKK